MPLHRLIYTSQICISDAEANPGNDIEKIVKSSSKKNRERGITGALFFSRGKVLQVLEGPLQILEQVFESICCDVRHEKIKLIEMVVVERRMFEEWGMTWLQAGDNQINRDISISVQEVIADVEDLPREMTEKMRSILRSQMHAP